MKHLLSTLGALACISAFVDSALNRQTAGPYELIDVNMQHCDDEGTRDISYTLKSRKVSKDAFAFKMNITIANVELGDNLDILVTVAQFTNGGWKENYFRKHMPHLCQTFKTFAPDMFDKLIGIGNNGVCPVPQGFYMVNETSLANFKLAAAPILFYNKYKVDANLLAKDVKVGCFRLQLEAIPKRKKTG